jgi:hypothetical protein
LLDVHSKGVRITVRRFSSRIRKFRSSLSLL